MSPWVGRSPPPSQLSQLKSTDWLFMRLCPMVILNFPFIYFTADSLELWLYPVQAFVHTLSFGSPSSSQQTTSYTLWLPGPTIRSNIIPYPVSLFTCWFSFLLTHCLSPEDCIFLVIIMCMRTGPLSRVFRNLNLHCTKGCVLWNIWLAVGLQLTQAQHYYPDSQEEDLENCSGLCLTVFWMAVLIGAAEDRW